MTHWLFIGHRGVGKSTLLAELKKEFSSCIEFYSLDSEIEARSGMTIKDIFEKESEQAFRKLEIETFFQVIKYKSQRPKVIDIGAGFLGDKPLGWKALWLKRKIKSSQSLFLNRPNLSGSLQIPKERFEQREVRYAQLADLELVLPEGMFGLTKQDHMFFSQLFNLSSKISLGSRWGWTVQGANQDFKISLLKKMNIGFLEWRDDLVAELKNYEGVKSLLSLRKSEPKGLPQNLLFDWPLEWGEKKEASVLSLHQREDSLTDTFKKFPETDQLLKLAIPIENFSELRQGHSWVLADPEKRVFLPMSSDGRWSWYRLLSSHWNTLNFLKWDKGSAADQPSLLEVLNFNSNFCFFAAILGSPVDHSLTPRYHQDFFYKKKSNVLRVNIKEDEFDEALPFLFELGMRWAAITSPLKNYAAQWAKSSLTSINTLAWSNERWKSTNTDGKGFEKLIAGFQGQGKVLWGGGGTLEPLKKIEPNLSVYSSREGFLKEGPEAKEPEVLIWGVGQSSFAKKGVFPPEHWPIQAVIDLNYTQDSPGRECAARYGCQYRSGLDMFIAQAKAQQEFWNEYGLK